MSREMKNSGIPWIGDIPKGWVMKRLKDVGFLYGGLTGKAGDDFIAEDDESCNYMRFIPFTNIFNNTIINPNQLYKVRIEDGEKQNLVNKNDILFLMSSEDYDGVGKPAILEEQIENLSLNSFCKGFRVTNVETHPKYLLYLLLSHVVRELVRQEAKGFIRINLRQDKLSTCPIMLPSLSEQQKIASFLDGKCSEIDEMIALQEKIVEELKAYKQSVITEAVTKGLNPDVPMKDSGIDWIGEIPEHWEVTKLNYFLSKVGSGSTPTGGSSVYTNQGVKFLRSQNVYFEGLRLDDIVYITDEIDESMKGTRVLEGDVLLNITGGSIGRCFYVDSTLGRANVNQHVSILRPKTVHTRYLKYFIQSEVGQHQVQLYQTGGNREGLSAAAIKEFRFFDIPVSEQKSISKFLDTKCTEIDNLISIKLSKIDSLKEYKKSIIYEYVTGKKEVI